MAKYILFAAALAFLSCEATHTAAEQSYFVKVGEIDEPPNRVVMWRYSRAGTVCMVAVMYGTGVAMEC